MLILMFSAQQKLWFSSDQINKLTGGGCIHNVKVSAYAEALLRTPVTSWNLACFNPLKPSVIIRLHFRCSAP